MKKLTSLIVVLFTIIHFTEAQRAGVPNGWVFNTNSSSGLLAHVQSNITSDLGNFSKQWAGIGQPITGAYGYRVQWNNNAGILALTGTGSSKKLELNWGGPGKTGSFEINQITSFTNPSGKINRLTVKTNGNVGIGTTNPTSNLTVTTSQSGTVALSAYSSGSTAAAMQAWATGSGSYGIFATGSVSAGIFYGNVTITGALNQGSDRKLKRNIEPMKNALEIVTQLQGKTYEFRTEEYTNLALPDGKHLGFIAQEVEEVLPEIVAKASQPMLKNPEGEDLKIEAFKSINYTALIPVLTEAIKEQQQIIDTQDEKILSLEERLLDLENARTFQQNNMERASSINQNEWLQIRPNPLRESATFTYSLPAGAQRAQIVISDVQGRQLSQYELDRSGTITIGGQSFEAGTYVCSLIVDGQILGVSKMQVIK